MPDIEDSAALVAWLRERRLIGPSEEVRTETLGGGVSSRTVRVHREHAGDLIAKQALDRLRVDVEWRCDPGRSAREAAALRWLNANAPAGAVMGLLDVDAERHVIVTEAAPAGFVDWKSMLMRGRVDAAHVLRFGALLAHLHGCGAEQRDTLMAEFGDRTYFEDLRVEPFYRYPAERVQEARGFLEDLVADLSERSIGFVHGDYSPKNILVDGSRMILVDHEVAHVGDPAFDVGFALAHLLSKAHALGPHRKALAQAAARFHGEYLRRIGQRDWSRGLEARSCRHAAGCLLARAVGRSPVEYLDTRARDRQREVVTELISGLPEKVDDLVRRFLMLLEARR